MFEMQRHETHQIKKAKQFWNEKPRRDEFELEMHETRCIISLVLLSSVGVIKTKANAQHCELILGRENA